MKTKTSTAIAILLRDYGFKVCGDTIIDLGVKGYIPARVWGKCRDVYDAAEQLRPIIADAEFSRRHTKLTSGN